jgi:pilus assembly protein Flp/PilA
VFFNIEKGKIMLAGFAHRISEFLEAEEGPTAVEYAVLLGLIVVACLVAITSLGTAANETFGNVGLQIAASGS